ncbi:tetratricopeptide repeat protein [Qipengyuania nanhaisediminis]|uniref:tetratricopeptide repeat protein n=1 Tax=Qipengyuania nanhaisediminis TaxID=604088 RepID=UPI0038B3098D
MTLFHPLRSARTTMLGAVLSAAVVVSAPVPAFAQDDSEARLRRAEAEIRALQRAVFPGGDGRFFEPQISASGSADNPATTRTPSTTAVTDILARLDAVEIQLQRLTALSEENTNSLALLAGRVSALESGGTIANTAGQGAVTAGSPSGATPQPSNEPVATGSNLAAMTGAASEDDDSSDVAQPAANGPSAERLAAVQAITKPQTDDPGDDEYSYGFRLWNAGFYPEARQQLAAFVEQYPDHPQITYGRNLLGRAFLDDGMPEEAARWFLRNYQADRTARRAPDSLLFLAESMIAMGDTRRACIALAEFAETYPAIATGRLADQYQSNRRRVTCEG